MHGKVSIIVPVYNSEDYLPKTLDSLKNQSYKNIEVILVNDGSTDLSYEICTRITQEDKRFKCFSSENRGVSAARNIGLSHATGDFIGFLDADDIFSVYFIEILLSYFNPGVDIVTSSYTKDLKDLVTHKDKSIKKSDPKIFDRFEGTNNLIDTDLYQGYVWNKIFRKELIKDLKFNENIHVLEDLIFSLEAFLLAEKICYVEMPLHYYRIHDFNTSQIFNRKKITMLEAQEICLNILNRNNDKSMLSIDDFKTSFFRDRISLFLSYKQANCKNKFIEEQLVQSISEIKLSNLKDLKLFIIKVISNINYGLLFYMYKLKNKIFKE